MTRLSPQHTRLLGVLLVAYGLLGAVIVVSALVIGAPAVGRVDEMISSAADTMGSASRAATTAANAFDGFGTSMDQARTSADDAASLSRAAAATSAELADAMSISIFGARPLIGLADEFSATSEQLQGLASDLEGIGAALAGSDDDLARVEVSLRSLAEDLTELRDQVETQRDDPAGSIGLLFYGFLLWLAVPVAASLAAGIALLRGSLRVPRSRAG